MNLHKPNFVSREPILRWESGCDHLSVGCLEILYRPFRLWNHVYNSLRWESFIHLGERRLFHLTLHLVGFTNCYQLLVAFRLKRTFHLSFSLAAELVLSLWHFPWASSPGSWIELLQIRDSWILFPVAVSNVSLQCVLRHKGCSDFPLIGSYPNEPSPDIPKTREW